MAAQYISDQIKTRGAKGVVDAADVAFSYKTEGIEQIDKSVKDIIEDLQQNGTNNSADHIIYSPTIGEVGTEGYKPSVSVKDKLDQLQETISDANLEGLVASAGQHATSAEVSYNKTKSVVNDAYYGCYVNNLGNVVATYDPESKKYKDSLGVEVIEGEDETFTLNGLSVQFVKGIEAVNSEYIDKFNEVLGISKTLSLSFENDSLFAVISQDEYKDKFNSNSLDPNTIYFCYTNRVSAEDLTYNLTITRVNNGGSIAATYGVETKTINTIQSIKIPNISYNSKVNLQVNLLEGYEIDSCIIGETVTTSVPEYITITEDTVMTITFKQTL